MPPTNHVVYKKNFLMDVVVKINFPVILDLSEDTPRDFQKKIQADFPILEPSQQITFEIKQGINLAQQKLNSILWKFSNKDNSEFIELDSGSLAIIFKKYKDYRTFKSKAQNIFNSFAELYSNIIITRLGLRYINNIILEGADYFNWTDYLNSNLINSINFYEDKTQLRRLITMSELAISEDAVLSFKYGILNDTYPSPIVKKSFILDYDCYTQVQIEKEQIISKMDTFHNEIKNKFETSITNSFREVLNHE